MICFGYICPVCETAIVGDPDNGGELCQLTHVRHSKVIGTIRGHYNGLGGVVEDYYFGGRSGRNSQEEILRSEYGFKDSYRTGKRRQAPSGREVRAYEPLTDLTVGSPERECFEIAIEGLNKELKGYANTILALEDELLQSVIGGLSCMGQDYYEKMMILANMKSSSNRYWLVLSKLYNDYILTLPDSMEAKSGVIAVHVACLKTLSKEERASLPFSKPDPDQSIGTVREAYKEDNT